jgi:peptide/nickel transport system substrate-binding protein
VPFTTSLKKRAAAALTLLGVAALISGCGSSGSSPAGATASNASSSTAGGSGSGGTLVVGMTAGAIPSLDTVESGGQGYEGFRFVGNQLYDGLTRDNLDSPTGIPRAIPDLASSWKTNPAATVWTFQLRPGVTFTDGTPWNAAAAEFNFERYLNAKDPYTTPTLVGLAATYAGSIKSFKVLGPMTFQITTKTPDAHLPEDVTTLYMASPAAVRKYGATGFANHPVGTGPFKFSSEVQGQSLTLLPNTHYWRGAPKLKELVLKPIPDVSQRIAALESGAVNWIEYPDPDDIAQLKAGGYQILQNPYDHIWTWVLDSSQGPTKSVSVRQALNYAIDRQAMVSDLLHNTATPAYQVAPRANGAYRPADNLYSYDPAKAKAMLKAAGYPHGFTLNVEYPTSGSGNMVPGPMDEELQSDLAKVGVTVNLHPIEWSTMLTQYVGGKFPAGIDVMAISLSFQQEAFWGEAFGTGSPINLGHYSDPKVDALLAKAQSIVNWSARYAVLAQAAKLITADAPWLFVVNDENPRALASTVHGFIEPESWFVDLDNVWVSK